MKTLPVTVLTFVLSFVAACSAGVVTELPSSDGNVAGGIKTPTPEPEAGTSSAPPPGNGGGSGTEPGPPVTTDAGAPPLPEAGGGSGYTIDSGTGGITPEAGPPPTQGALGTCGNPLCGTDTNECGCQATDSAGNTVQMGCQAGGECVCLVNQQETDNPFDENGACGDQTSTAAQFISNCTCQ
jgi:hypothetical protein